jgi:hypothetical protein
LTNDRGCPRFSFRYNNKAKGVFALLPSKIEKLQNLLSNMDSYFKSLLDISPGTTAETIFDTVAENSVPFIGEFIQNVKINNLQKGLEDLNSVVSEMQVTLNKHEENFVKEKALPLILRKISQEEQEEKIRIIVNGFESIIYDSMYHNDSLYEFFDVLENLRVKEIARLLQLYNREFEGAESYHINNLTFDGTSAEYIDNKLIQLGLRSLFVIDGGTFIIDANPRKDTSFTKFGIEFIKFFRSRKIENQSIQ